VPTAGWDILPTLYDLAGGADPLPVDLDGVSLAKAIQGTPPDPNNRSLIFHFPWYNGEPESAIRKGPYKLLKNLDTLETALYDVARDPGEKTDLSSSHPEIAHSLDQELETYLKSVDAETVNQLRGIFLANIEGSWLENAEKRAADLRTAAEAGDLDAGKQLDQAEKYVRWLKEQVVYTRERMALHENRKD
jgi:arylsulfatase A-like enzyme